ncbi:MAG: divergent PAP2 family protein [Clostridia bacterium]|nr:divergent PAP2 family protein [Clostridia bacterium]
MQEILQEYKYFIIPLSLWFGIQIFKVIYDRVETKEWHLGRFWGAGGMPSSHSAVVVSLATLIGKNIGVNSPLFALSGAFAFIVMYDAAGVRRAVGKQAKILNDILTNQKLTGVEKLQEMTGHTPIQVLTGAFIGFVGGMMF